MDLRKLTLLHSNDMHGDFFDEAQNEVLVGGISRMSGYIRQVRTEETPTLFVIAGDMLQGSIIDHEFKGISTIDIINALEPDIVTLGNHELDYGLGHLMFLEKCAKFPIINANLYIKPTGTKLFQGYKIIEIDGLRVLFIGIITEEVMEFGKSDPLLGAFVDINEAAKAVSYYINNFKDVDIDLTVLLTHVGIEADKKLAQLLPRELGVDVIIGGHSHTLLEQPCVVNDILIVQVGCGTDQIGRFDLVIDRNTDSIHHYDWNVIPINSETCPIDEEMERLLTSYTKRVDDKYNRVIRRLSHRLTHPNRYQETELGNYVADVFASRLELDIMLFGSGAIRAEALDALVTLRALREALPYDDSVLSFFVSGAQLRSMFEYHFKLHYSPDCCKEFYQVNSKLHLRVDEHGNIVEFDFDGTPISEIRLYRVGMQGFHFAMIEHTFGIPQAKLFVNGPIRTVTTSCHDIIDEEMEHSSLKLPRVEGRIELARPLPAAAW